MTEMISIDIDTEVFKYLQQHAEPLTDNPNQVLRRLLGLTTASESAAPWPRRIQASRPPSPATTAVIAALRDNPEATTREVARAAGVAPSTCLRILSVLHDEGAAIRQYDTSESRGTKYRWRTATENEHSEPRAEKNDRPVLDAFM
jgi:negative regulator of replication initiation